MGKGKRTKALRRADEEAQAARRPPAPVLEWIFEYVCSDCGTVAGKTTGRGPEVALQIPGRCMNCQGHRFGVRHSAKILNQEDYPGGIEGFEFAIKHDPARKPVWRFRSTDEIYRRTGQLFRYERLFDYERDRYYKRYTNLETGAVEVEEEEPLSEHTGRGAARQSRPENQPRSD